MHYDLLLERRLKKLKVAIGAKAKSAYRYLSNPSEAVGIFKADCKPSRILSYIAEYRVEISAGHDNLVIETGIKDAFAFGYRIGYGFIAGYFSA